MMKHMYSTKDAASILDVTVRGIEGWRLSGQLTPLKPKGRCLYTEDELKRFLGITDPASLEQMYNTEGVAEILGITPRKVEQWREEGKLTALRAGRLWRYSEDEIRRFLGLDYTGAPFPTQYVNKHGEAIDELAEAQKAA